MRNIVLAFIIALVFSATAVASEVAISTQANWWGQAAADREVQEIADNVTGMTVELFSVDEQDALAAWVDDHTGDGRSDLLILCGQFPDTIYEPGNGQADDSLAELFLDDGNTIINTGDYAFYVVNGAGTNAAGGLQTMMDIAGITMWDDDTAVTVTADGAEFTPSLQDFQTDRPFHLDELEGDWEPELILAGNDAGTRADPVIVYNADTGGRLGIFFQTSGQDDDPRGEVISEWINNWYIPNVAGGGGNPLARRPDPEDGAVLEQTWGTLSWKPGFYAASHDVYIGTNFDDVNEGAAETFAGNTPEPSQIVGFVGFPIPDGLVPGTTYYWRVDEVNDANAASPWKGDVWSFWVPSNKAYDPTVSDGAEFVPTEVELGWTAGFGARIHYVYFGDDFDTVANATGALPQTQTTFTPSASLEEEKTYYWRVDESDGMTTYPGDVWSFTTVPDVPVSDPDLVGWWKLDEGAGNNVVDWSGHGNHGALAGDPEWTDGVDGGALSFDGSGDWVPTGLMPADFGVDGGNAKTVTAWVYTTGYNNGGIYDMGSQSDGQEFCLRTLGSLNDWRVQRWGYPTYDFDVTYPSRARWVHFAQVYSGTDGGNTTTLYADGVVIGSQTIELDTADTPFVIGRYGGSTGFDGVIDDVRFYNKALTAEEVAEVMLGDPKLAGDPVPGQDAIVDIREAASASWSAGDGAVSHDVYFGTDRDAVAGADNDSPEFQGNQAGTSLNLEGLVEFGGGDYYWRVDEVESGGAVNPGTIWSFTVPDRLIVDDFESYNDIEEGEPGSNRIYLTWIDGFGTTTNGAVAGNLDPPFASLDVVRSGAQAMPLSYDNAGKTSEATMSLADGDWTAHGVTKLELWFQGDSANAAERMFVALGNAVVYHPDDAATQDAGWNEWEIDLQKFADQGTDLANVPSITLGFGTRNAPVASGGTGTVYFDDIGLVQ